MTNFLRNHMTEDIVFTKLTVQDKITCLHFPVRVELVTVVIACKINLRSMALFDAISLKTLNESPFPFPFLLSPYFSLISIFFHSTLFFSSSPFPCSFLLLLFSYLFFFLPPSFLYSFPPYPLVHSHHSFSFLFYLFSPNIFFSLTIFLLFSLDPLFLTHFLLLRFLFTPLSPVSSP